VQTVPTGDMQTKPTEDIIILNKPKEDSEVKLEKERKKQEAKQNVFGIERYPVPQYRWGFLPISVEVFLHTKNNKYIVKTNPSYIQSGKRPLLRYGVEFSNHQSFIAVIADIYSSYKKIKLLNIEQMREKIIELITLDDYLKLNNGSLTSIFKPNKYPIDDVSVEDYRDSYFYSKINLNDPLQYSFLKDSISSFQNFQNYLKDSDSMIDHTYIWDIISSEESVLFEGGLNLVIMDIPHNDITNNIDILCPMNTYSANIYKKDRGTILILKHDNFYEPIYFYEGKEKKTGESEGPVKIFTNLGSTEELKNVRKVLNMIMNVSERKCKPIHSRPRLYTIKENVFAISLKKNIEDLGYTIKSQVMNYNGKIIALMAMTSDNKVIYLPCFPSKQLRDIDVVFMNSVETMDYVSTRDLLNKISFNSQGKIICKPIIKVIEDGLIVGILTETNQFVQISEPVTDTYKDGLIVVNGLGYKNGELDYTIVNKKEEDELRLDTVRNIRLETQFYISFRTAIRNLLNDYNYREIREKIVSILDNTQFLYTLKMKKLNILIRHLTGDSFSFVGDIDTEIKQKIGELSNCGVSSSCDIKSFCLKRHGKLCFPSKNLVNNDTDNNNLYYAKICDELIRYKRIRLFMLDNKRYLNMSDTDYSINDDEVLLLNSILTDEYFDGLVPFLDNKYVKNITYEIANPSKNSGFYQNFSNKVPLAEQGEGEPTVPL